MSITGSLSHIDISAGYPDRSIPFYDTFFRALGYRRWKISGSQWTGDRPQRAAWWIKQPNGSTFGVEVRPARAESRDRKYDRYEPGPHHLAFHAESREAVHRVHEAMLAAGAKVLDPPVDYGGQPGYSDGYFAVFFADPDDLKLEVAYIPE